jgi:hypothetical protein
MTGMSTDIPKGASKRFGDFHKASLGGETRFKFILKRANARFASSNRTESTTMTVTIVKASLWTLQAAVSLITKEASPVDV